MAKWTLAAQHPLTRKWSNDEDRLIRLAEDHEFDLVLSTDLDLATLRATLAPGHEPEELFNRWVSVSPELSALLSIRFEGLDPAKPFVDATVSSRPFEDTDLTTLKSVAAETFGSFGPRYVRVWSAAPTDAFPDTLHDKRFMAAPVRDLAASGTVGMPTELSLTPTKDLHHWDDAAAAYGAVDTDHPHHPDQARLQAAEDLQESIHAGTLFDVLVDSEWAGWVGATTDTTSSLGLACYEVQEIILIPAFRGRGYGSCLTTLLARQLPHEDHVLIGTIHADNRGALTAAHLAGRHDVGGWFQVPL